jgi:hypothetical protein
MRTVGFRTTALVLLLLITACAKTQPEPAGTADQFMRAYFVDDDVAAAAKLASGAAKSTLEAALLQVRAAGDTELAQDRPKVKITLMETRVVSASDTGYPYRVEPETSGIQPITVKLNIHKDGNVWTVDDFVQTQ